MSGDEWEQCGTFEEPLWRRQCPGGWVYSIRDSVCFVPIPNRTIVPAQPDFYRVDYCADITRPPDKPITLEDVGKLPIVAWVIMPDDREFAAEPITADGMVSDQGTDFRGGSAYYWAVLQPNGRVVIQGDQICRTLLDWVEHINGQRDRDIEIYRTRVAKPKAAG